MSFLHYVTYSYSYDNITSLVRSWFQEPNMEKISIKCREDQSVCDFGIFDQDQVQDGESSHYGLWQISIGSNDEPLYNTAKKAASMPT